jgi:hypothetical protein
VDERLYSASTLCFKRRDLEAAKNMIEDFLDEFDRRFSADNDGDEVYQIGVQLFSHTRKEKGDVVCSEQP